MNPSDSQPTVVSTSRKPHKTSLMPKFVGRASAFPTHLTAFQDGFKVADTQKNKINLCFVDRLVQIDKDKKIKAK
jgi:hypothetical protein